MPVVYSLSFPGCEKRYIGSTSKLRGRLAQHRFLLARGQHHSSDFQEEACRHGIAELKVEILEEVADASQLLDRERHWLDLYHGSLFNSLAFPTRKGASTPADTRAKISKSLVGNQNRRGIPHNVSTRAKIGAAVRASYEIGNKTVSLHPENLADHNAAVARGDKPHPSRDEAFSKAVTAHHAKTRSPTVTGAAFGITGGAVLYHVRKTNPSQIRKWRRKCATQ